jgi:hypothetical protein
VLPDRALYLPTFSHLLIVNELLSRSLYRSTGFTLRSALKMSKKHQGSNTKGQTPRVPNSVRRLPVYFTARWHKLLSARRRGM